ncbi:MAG: hypothetical protein ACFBSG_18925 [Leptolyngbyaceae cyanobacterium]
MFTEAYLIPVLSTAAIDGEVECNEVGSVGLSGMTEFRKCHLFGAVRTVGDRGCVQIFQPAPRAI